MTRTERMLHAPIGRTLAGLAVPNVLAQTVTVLTSIAEAAFAGRLGVTALAGLALVYPLVMLTQMLSAGALGGAMSAAVARAMGRRDDDHAGQVATAGWIIAGTAALLIAGVMGVWGGAIFRLLGADGAALEAAMDYAGIYFPGSIAVWACLASLGLIRGTGNMRMPAITLIAVSLISIPLSGALALGWGPFPPLGMAGLAAGQILAQSCAALIALWVLISGQTGLRPRLRPGARAFGDILRIGLVAALSPFQTVLTVVLMTALVGRYGAEALAGYGLGARLEFLMVPIAFGIGTAMTAMVGTNIGAGQRARALRIAWTGAGAAAAIVGGLGLIAALWPDAWLALFISSDAAQARVAGQGYLHIVGPFYAFFALGLTLYFAGQGAGRVIWPVMGGFARLVVAYGTALLLMRHTDLGLTSVFIGIAAGMTAYGALTAIALYLNAWREKASS